MEIKKIQLQRSGLLNVTYVDDDGNTVAMSGANVVHRDLKDAMRSLVAHMAIMTEQREAQVADLETLQAKDSLFAVLSVNEVVLSDDGQEVSLGGTRILKSGRVMKIATPKECLQEDAYEYCGELAVAIDAVVYEAKEYVRNKKWGIKQAELFVDDPFEGVEAGEVPTVDVEVKEVAVAS